MVLYEVVNLIGDYRALLNAIIFGVMTVPTVVLGGLCKSLKFLASLPSFARSFVVAFLCVRLKN